MTTFATVAAVAVALLFALDRNTRLWLRARRADARAIEATTRAVRAEHERDDAERVSDWMARAFRAERRLDTARLMSDGLRRMLTAEIKLHARPTDEQFVEFTHADVRPLVDDGGAR